MANSLTSFLFAGALFILNGLALADECQPHTWSPVKRLDAGQINCRYQTTTRSKVDSNTCVSLAEKYETTVEEFLKLNPSLDKECRSIKPNQLYCVKGCK
jgi:hypothetical protein